LKKRVILYGAAGHTGQFIAAEAFRRGWETVLAGRDLAKLAPVSARYGAEAIQVDATDHVSLDKLLNGADAVINAAGPFGDTAPGVIEAALRARIPYLDVTAEPFVAQHVFETYADAAREAGTIVAPAFGFFGALGDLLVSAALNGSDSADHVELAFALDRWKPTKGTRLAGERRAGRRLIRLNGRLETREPAQVAPKGSWKFEQPFGEQPTIGEFSTVDVVTISRHIDVDRISTWLNQAPLADLLDPDSSGPEAVDESGRSAQQFAIEAVVHLRSERRHARATGQDIYAVTAPIVGEAVSWIFEGRSRATGVVAAGELFDAGEFLNSLSPAPLAISLQ
jgi:hypothetical protein